MCKKCKKNIAEEKPTPAINIVPDLLTFRTIYSVSFYCAVLLNSAHFKVTAPLNIV